MLCILHMICNLIVAVIPFFGQSYYVYLHNQVFGLDYWIFVFIGIIILAFGLSRLTNVRLFISIT